MANFIECNLKQQYLLPPALEDWLPPKDLAWLIIDAVDAMYLSAFYNWVSRYCGEPGAGSHDDQPISEGERRDAEMAVHASAPTL